MPLQWCLMIALVLFALPALQLKERWSFELPWVGTEYNAGSAEAMGNCVFYLEHSGSAGGRVGCLDARTGKLLWRTTSSRISFERLAVGSGYLVAKREDELVQLSPKDGRIVWRQKVEPYHLGPFIVGNRLVAETSKGRLVAIDLQTHKPLWRLQYPAEFRGYTRNGAAAVDEGALWTDAADGQVLKVSLKNGHILVKRPFAGGKLYDIVPMGSSVALIGDKSTVAWRSSDGEPLWKKEMGGVGGFYFAARQNELWRLPGDGNLYRYRTSDGDSASPAIPFPDVYGSYGAPVRYGSEYLLGTQDRLLRLDDKGRPTAFYSTGENRNYLAQFGSDLLLYTTDRIVRLTPGSPPLPKNPVQTARRIVAMADIGVTDRVTLERLGRAAVPAIVSALKRPAGKDEGTLRYVLFRIADVRDTATIFGLARDNREYASWLEDRGDADWLAVRLLPRLRATSDEREQVRLLALVERSTRPDVTAQKLAMLRSPKVSDWVKESIYPSLAVGEHPAALAEILRLRGGGRRLAKPIEGTSLTADRDADGIPDAYDANPSVAPRPLNETERVLFAAFDARFRFDTYQTPMLSVDYGPKVRPFELVGWQGGLRPIQPDVRNGGGHTGNGLWFETLSLDGEVVRFEKGGTEAVVRIARVMEGGTEARLRKIAGEWFVVSQRVTWQN